MQTLHKTLHKLHISLIIRTLRNVGFMFQTLHKSYTRTYTNPTQKHSKTIHKRNANPTRKPTLTQRQTLHKSVQKLYTNATQILHGNRHKRNAKPYTKAFKNYTQNLSQSTHQLYTPPTFWFWTRNARNVQKLMRHLTRQLMGINGETVLAGSAPRKN